MFVHLLSQSLVHGMIDFFRYWCKRKSLVLHDALYQKSNIYIFCAKRESYLNWSSCKVAKVDSYFITIFPHLVRDMLLLFHWEGSNCVAIITTGTSLVDIICTERNKEHSMVTHPWGSGWHPRDLEGMSLSWVLDSLLHLVHKNKIIGDILGTKY